MKISANHPISDLTIKILIASFLAQFIIVASHHFVPIGDSFAGLEGDYLSFIWTRRFVRIVDSAAFSTIGPTVFFIISGFLFYKGYEADGAWKRKVLSRVRTLGIPYIFWNLLASPYMVFILVSVAGLFIPLEPHHVDFSLKDIFLGSAPGFYPANAALWYIRELMIMVVLSPLLWRVIRSRFAPWFIGVLFIIWGIIASKTVGGLENISQAAFGFTFGGYICRKEKTPFDVPTRIGIISFLAFIFLVGLQLVAGTEFKFLVILINLTGFVALFAVADRLARSRFAIPLAWLGEASMFIYVVHLIHRKVIADKIIALLNPTSDIAAWLAIVVAFIFIFVYTFGAWLLLRNLAPKLLNFIMGGRSRRHFSLKAGSKVR